MLRHSPPRSGYGPLICATTSPLLLVLSFFIHSRLSASLSFPLRFDLPTVHPRRASSESDPFASHFDDAENHALNKSVAEEDRIDELDVSSEEEYRGRSAEAEEEENGEADDEELEEISLPRTRRVGLFWDESLGVTRRRFGWSEQDRQGGRLPSTYDTRPLPRKIAFGSDDQPEDEDVRLKISSIGSIEEALLLKVGPGESLLREGWAWWLERKGNFLRRDRMLQSKLELLNPQNHPLLLDPDGPGLTALTQGDRLFQRELFKEMKKNHLSLTEGVETKKSLGRTLLDVKDNKTQEEPLEGWMTKASMHTGQGLSSF